MHEILTVMQSFVKIAVAYVSPQSVNMPVFMLILSKQKINLYRVSTKKLSIENDTENKRGILRTSHIHQPIKEKSQSFVSNDTGDLLRASPRCH
jgi:hypothetical protein